MLLLERRDAIALPALPFLEAQHDVALMIEREAFDAGLLVRRQIPGKIAKALEHALQLTAPSLLVVRRKEFLRVFFVVFGELALERRELRGCERGEHGRGVLGRFRREPAVAQAHVGEPPGDVLRRDAPGRALTGAAQQGRVRRKLARPVPLVKSHDARGQIVGLRSVEIQIARGHEAQHGVGVVVGEAGRAAGGEHRRADYEQQAERSILHQ